MRSVEIFARWTCFAWAALWVGCGGGGSGGVAPGLGGDAGTDPDVGRLAEGGAGPGEAGADPAEGGADPTEAGAGPTETGAGLDEAAVMAASARYASLNKINRVPFTSAAGQAPHAGDPMVDVYIDSSALDTYAAIDPASTAPAGPFGEGTLIVKYNEASPPFLTVMYKAPAGYDPSHGDWWYGRLNTDGTSTGYTGRVDFCISCHGVRASQDYTYGVPVDDR